MNKTMLRVATWNVNSIRRRIDGFTRLVHETAPDVICLQETKVTDALFPALAVEEMGYPYRAIHGEKAYNGVAILSRLPIVSVSTRQWCGRSDARHILAAVDAGPGLGEIEVHSLYVPAGGDLPDADRNPKFAHKLRFLDAGAAWGRRRERRPAILCGDFNVAPLECDVWSHEKLKNVITHTPPEIERLDRMQSTGGWIDAVRRLIPAPEPVFTWWSYRAIPGWEVANKGRRLDHVWVSPDLSERLRDASVLRSARGWDLPSDHVPVIVDIDAR